MTQSILAAAVARIRASGLSGKARDDAAGHFIAGAKAALDAALDAASNSDDVPQIDVPESGKYVDVLEALAATAGE